MPLRDWFAGAGQGRGLDLTRTATATSGPGGATPPPPTPSSPAPTWTPSRRRRLRRPARCGLLLRRPGRAAGQGRRARPGRSASSTSATRKAPASASPALGSRLATGRADPRAGAGAARRRRRHPGRGHARGRSRPEALGPDPETLARIGAFVELHVEQGRALATVDAPVGVATASGRTAAGGSTSPARPTTPAPPAWPTAATRCSTYAKTVLAARPRPRRTAALATFGKISVEPNGVNAIPSLVTRLAGRPGRRRGRLDGLVAAIDRSVERGRPTARGRGRPRSPGPPTTRFDPPCATGWRRCSADAAGPRHRRRPRRRYPRQRRRPDRDALRPQPDRRLPLPAEYADRGRLPGRGRRARRRTGGPGGADARDDLLGRARLAARTASRPASRRRGIDATAGSPRSGHGRRRAAAPVDAVAAPACRCPASPTPTATPSTGPCAAVRTRAAAPSGPGAS